jgi:hypothetical protein
MTDDPRPLGAYWVSGDPSTDPGERKRLIRDRAYLISQGPDAGSPEENWLRAEREHDTDAVRRAELEEAGLVESTGRAAATRAALTHP